MGEVIQEDGDWIVVGRSKYNVSIVDLPNVRTYTKHSQKTFIFSVQNSLYLFLCPLDKLFLLAVILGPFPVNVNMWSKAELSSKKLEESYGESRYGPAAGPGRN